MHRSCPAGLSPATGWVRLAVLTCGLFVTALAGAAPIPATGDAEATGEQPEFPPGVPRIEDLVRTPFIRTASKFEQRTSEAPSSVTVITAQDIKHYGYRTLADILRSVPGLHVSYDRKNHVLGVRGFSRGDLNSRILLLINGHRINDSLMDGADIGTTFPLDVDLIDHVEIIRGPGSVLYGNNAFFGVINLITRRGRDLQGGELTGEYAQYDTYKGRLTYGYNFKEQFEMLLSGTLLDRMGPDHGGVERTDDDTFGSAFGSFRYRDFTLEGGYIKRDKADPTGQSLAIRYDPRSRSVDERSYVSLKYARNFTNAALEVMGRVYADRNDLDVYIPLAGDPELDHQVQAGRWWGTELQLTKRLFDRHTLTLGGEYRHDYVQSLKHFPSPNQPPSADLARHTENHGVFLQGDFAVLTNLHVNAGIRYDQYADLDPTFNPRVALIYNPFEQSALKAIYGTAFRAPNFIERVFGAPGLDAETITTYELVYEQGIGKHLRSSVAGFFNRIDDLITFQGGSYRNLKSVDAQGLELSLEGFWANGVRGRLSYTLQHVEDRSTGDRLTDSPIHLAKANVTVPLYPNKIFAGLEYQYTSRRKTDFSLRNGETELGSDVAGYGVFNLTLFSREVVQGLEFSASVYNLLDQRYGDPSTPQHLQDTIWQDGRSFRIKLLYRF